MPNNNLPQAKLTIVACFPEKSFLENFVIRQDHSMLVTSMLSKELWYVPAPGADLPVEPMCIQSFDQPTLGIVETDPEIFYLATSNLYTTHESYLHRLDLRGWQPGMPLQSKVVLQFPDGVKGPNGICLLAPTVMLVADCFAGLIWRVDLDPDGGPATARMWLQHASMDYDPDGPDASQPGVNGLKYAAKTNYVYFTSTEKQLFMRVPVDPATYEATNAPEFVAAGRMADDFCLDEEAGVGYLTTHRQNTIDRVWLEPRKNLDFERNSVSGHPFDPVLVGPSSGLWGRQPGDYGRTAYFISDGGTKSPPHDGKIRPAKLLRVEFPPL